MKTKRRLLPLALCGLLLFSAASCTIEKEETAIVWSALSTEKYRRDQVLDSYAEAELTFVGMKGETSAMQVMITAKEDIKSFDLELSDLQGEDGSVFSKDNLKAYATRYVDVYDPWVNYGRKLGGELYIADAGFYPDALVPLDKYIANREAKIAKGNNQGIWVDCVIPANAVAGEYTGSFTLSYGEETKEIPVTLTVYDLTMPEEVHSATYFGIYYDQLALGEKENYSLETDQIYYDYLLSKRMCSDDVMPRYRKDLPTFYSHIVDLAQNPKVTSYLLPNRLISYNKEVLVPTLENEGKYTQERQDQEADKLEASLTAILQDILNKNLEEIAAGKEGLDLFKKLVFGFEDEPNMEYRFKRIRIFGERLTAAKRTVLERNAEAFETYPELKASFELVQQICATTGVSSELFVSSKNGAGEPYVPDYEKGDGLTYWCPEEYMFKDAGFRAEVKERQALGERFMWYTCCANSPILSYYVESIPVNIRAHAWKQYEYGLIGMLYWDVVHWNTVNGGDPYEDVSHDTGWGAGEGLLLYPGIKYGMKTPISSIRMEQLFHGQQDYEYFYMLEGYMKANKIETTVSQLINKLTSKIFYEEIFVRVDAKGSDLEASRIQILDLLQLFADGKVEEAKTKINAIMA